MQSGSRSREDNNDIGYRKESDEWNIHDLLYLALCWALTLTTSTLLTTIGPLAAKHVGSSDILAPFTIGTFLLGAAFSSVPSGPLFRQYGRYGGFAVGCACQMIGSAAGALGMVISRQEFLFIGCFFVGLGQGLGQFYRFAAVEISPDEFKSKAVTYVLTGGILAAFLGPTSANYSVHLAPGAKYAGSFLIMGGIGILNWVVLSLVNFPSSDEAVNPLARGLKRRTVCQIASHPIFILSCTVATIAHTVMVMIMSNCALSMEDDYSFNTTSIVIELHFLGMFAPGFFTGRLIQDFGTFNVSVGGAVLFALSSLVFILGESLWNYFLGMILLGVAWNFSFSAGTVMLTQSYLPHEAADVQALNDFILFTVAGAGSLASGIVFSKFSWAVLIYVSAVMMVINLLLFTVVWKMKKELTSESAKSKGVLTAPLIADYDEDTANGAEEWERSPPSVDGFDGRNLSLASVSSVASMYENREKVRSISVA